MDIAALSTQMSQIKVQEQAGMAVMKKAMDASQANANQILEMMEVAQMPGKGENINILA